MSNYDYFWTRCSVLVFAFSFELVVDHSAITFGDVRQQCDHALEFRESDPVVGGGVHRDVLGEELGEGDARRRGGERSGMAEDRVR